MACIRRAWLVMGSHTLELEDGEAGYYTTELDLGYPEPREVTSNRPDRAGTLDRTCLPGARAISANITARGGAMSVDEIATLFAPFMDVRARPELHYVLDRPGAPERFTTLRASGYTWPVSGKTTREIHLGWVAPDPVMHGAVTQKVIALAGSSVQGGRLYDLIFDRAYMAGGGSSSVGEIITGGDLPIRPTLEIFGPITDPVVILEVQDPALPAPEPIYRLAFREGFRIDPGRWVRVDTDALTATDDAGASILDQIDWAATIWPVVPVAPTITYLSLAGTSTTGVSQVQAIWTDAFLT
jgi:hypothetical protein